MEYCIEIFRIVSQTVSVYYSMSSGSPLDRILSALMTVKAPPPDGYIKLNEADLGWLCNEAISALKKDPVLLEIEAPLCIVGDLHGQFFDLLEYFSKCGWPPKTRYLFLGDYVDRGDNSVETFALLLALKVKYPQQVFLLRGNHETNEISETYGFLDECIDRYTEKVWKTFTTVYPWLPIAAVISERVFCVHGGISPQLHSLSQIREIQRPLEIPSEGLLIDLLWADPSCDHAGFVASQRGVSFTFGQDAAEEFLEQNDFDLLCRAHQIVQCGFEFPFYPSHSVMTLFSAPDYCKEFGNSGAILKVSPELKCSFEFVERSGAKASENTRPATPYC